MSLHGCSATYVDVTLAIPLRGCRFPSFFGGYGPRGQLWLASDAWPMEGYEC